MIKLYLASLRQEAANIIIRHHPLCHRHDKQSLEVIHSARWAPSLLHEIHYPATARLCVATSANVIVYRVSRHGNHGVSVSHGVGIAVSNPNMTIVQKLHESTMSEKVNNRDDSVSTKHNKRLRKEETCNSAEEQQTRKAKKVAKKSVRQRTGQRKNTTQRQKRHVKVDSDSGSVSDDSDESSTQESSEYEESYSLSSSSDDNTSEEKNNQVRFTLIDYHWLYYEQLLIITNIGVHIMSLWNNSSDEENKQILTLPQEPHYTLVHDTLGVNALFIACTYLFKIDNVLRCKGDDGNCSSKSTYLLFLASPFVIRVLLVISYDPLQCLETNKRCTLDSSINSISNTSGNSNVRSATVSVVGLHYIEVQAMKSVPASLCCYIDDNDDHHSNTDWANRNSNGPNIEENHVELNSEMHIQSEQVKCYVMDVNALISSPNETIRGMFEVRIDSDILATTMLTKESIPLQNYKKEEIQSEWECNKEHKLIASEWRVNACFDLSLLANETALRSLHLVNLSSFQFPLSQELVQFNMSDNAPLPLSSQYFMIGVTRHCVFGFTSRGMQPILLFQCPSLASAFEMPLHSALAVSGIAIHASCTLALLLLQNGQVNSVSMFVKPVCVNDTTGLLNRMLTLCGMNSSYEKNTNTINHLQQDYHTGEVHTTRTPITNSRTNYSSQPLLYSLSRHNSMQLTLWERQHSYSFFIWEQLFPSDAECVSLRLYSEECKRLMHQNRNNSTVSTKPLTTNNRSTDNVNRKYDNKGSCNLNKNVLSCLYFTTEALCRRYLELRDEYGVDLFLRYLMPNNKLAFTQCLHIEENNDITTSTRLENRRNSNHRDLFACNAKHWQWWELLLAIWRRAPCHVWCLYEIILANALLVMAKYTHYANFDLSSNEIFEQTSDTCSTNTQTLSYCGAVTFVQMYIAHEMELISIQEYNNINNNNTQENKNTSTLHEPLPSLNLHKAGKWVKHLSEWMEHYCADMLCTHDTCVHNEVNKSNTNADKVCCSNNKYNLIDKCLFACSLCDAAKVAKLTSAFSYDVVHSSHERHTTIFSPKTFCALSMLSDEAVLTKCRDCGFRDYARHALCVICGGVLVENISKKFI